MECHADRRVAGAIDLVGLQFIQQIDGWFNIIGPHGFLFDGACFVEGQVHEMRPVFGKGPHTCRWPLASQRDQALDGTDLFGIFFG